MNANTTGRGSDQFNLRFPEGMRERISQSAQFSGRSMNSEIIQRLARSFEDESSDALKLDLPGDLWNSLMVDASLHEQSMDQRAAELLRGIFSDGVFDEPSEYAKALDKIRDTVVKLADAQDRNADLKQGLDIDFLLYFNKVVQLRQFANLVLSDSESTVSDRVKAMASDLENLTKSEISTFEDRQRYAQLHKTRKESVEADDENEDITLAEVLPMANILNVDKPKS